MEFPIWPAHIKAPNTTKVADHVRHVQIAVCLDDILFGTAHQMLFKRGSKRFLRLPGVLSVNHPYDAYGYLRNRKILIPEKELGRFRFVSSVSPIINVWYVVRQP